MALFGLLKDSKDPGGMTGNDKLALLFSGISDFGSMRAGQEANAIDSLTKAMQGRRQKTAQDAALNSLLEAATGKSLAAPAPITDPQSAGDYAPKFAPTSLTSIPQLPQARSAPMSYNDPALPRLALEAKRLGADPAVLMDWMKNNAESDYVNGVRTQKYGQGPAFIPQFDKGQAPVMGPDGTITGIQNMNGAVNSAAEMAGAVSGAQEGAKSAFDLVDVPQRDGSTRKMTRFQAAQMLSGQGGALPQGLGVSQTPGARIAQEGMARTDVERAAAEPQQWSGLQTQARTTDLVIDNIDKALKQISPLSTGFAANLGGMKGTAAHDLQATLNTIGANIGFDRLDEMRKNSPTGGALGSVSEQENKLLQSVMGSLDPGQSPDQLRANLKTVRDQLARVREQRKSLYSRTYGGGGASGGKGGNSAPQGAWTPAQARAELARRRAAAGGQ